MVINGVEIDFKISRLQDASNMEIALRNMEKEEDKIRKAGKDVPMSEMLKKMICVFSDFFKTATGVDVLHGCGDFMEAKEAYSAFIDAVHTQKEILMAPFSVDRIK